MKKKLLVYLSIKMYDTEVQKIFLIQNLVDLTLYNLKHLQKYHKQN